jgi:hypothetical protein
MVACSVAVNRAKVTVPVAATAASRTTIPKSAIHVSRSAPIDVDALVSARICIASACSHIISAATALARASSSEPETKLIADFAFACTAAAYALTICCVASMLIVML